MKNTIKKQILFLLIILTFNCYSQISFEKGYYIDNTNQKINCLIKNVDWRDNPIEFEYKLSENSESKKATIKTIKEFGIGKVLKYVRSVVNIDKSSDDVNSLSENRNPVFTEEELFLKVIIEGKASLYLFQYGDIKRFFYNKDSSKVEQLIFKKYLRKYDKIGTNNRYKQQLWSDLKCSTFKLSKVENLDYKKSKLAVFFEKYNKCNNQEYVIFEEKQKRDLFNLTIRPRLNSSSLTIENSVYIDYESKTGFGLGVEAEFILPIRKNKWAIAIEPTYQSFKAEKTLFDVSNVSGGTLKSEVDYSSIEVPISLRHYFFINDTSKIFINGSYIFHSALKSSIEFKRGDDSSFNSLEINARANFGFGIGYKQNDRYSLEFRFQTDRDVLAYSIWNSDYKTLSIIFGYSLF